MVAMTLGTLAGGGGLITVPAMLLMGIPIHSVIGAGKISTTVSSFSTFMTVLLKKQITFKESFWIIPISLTGGFTGGFIATRLTESTCTRLRLSFLSLHSYIILFESRLLGGRRFKTDESGSSGFT